MASASRRILGFGIIGAGMIADFHARAIMDAPDCRLIGVCGRSTGRTGEFARRHEVPFATTDLHALLSRTDIDVICITTPSGAHLEPAVAAAQAGKHIVMEKPLEVTLDRIDAMLEATQKAGVVLMPIFQARTGENVLRLKSALVSGRFGRLVLASAYVKWQRSAAYYADSWHGTLKLDGGGALINQAIHGLDLLQWLAGMPSEVFSWNTRRVHTGIEGEDTAVASLRYPCGALGSIEATTAMHPGWARRIEICGEHGSAVLEDDFLLRWDFRSARDEDKAILAARPDPTMRSGAGAPDQMTHEGHLRQISNLANHLRAGTALEVDGPEARKAVALIQALYTSARSGRSVHLPA
ncbi:MAG: Gfo/Idh/MocA family oxidoreductase [Opitutaceae bacterium]|nr:Gfo/Idh/MocA family oxidoreductase [Opitutaceae bacterium]